MESQFNFHSTSLSLVFEVGHAYFLPSKPYESFLSFEVSSWVTQTVFEPFESFRSVRFKKNYKWRFVRHLKFSTMINNVISGSCDVTWLISWVIYYSTFCTFWFIKKKKTRKRKYEIIITGNIDISYVHSKIWHDRVSGISGISTEIQSMYQ